MLWNSVLSFCFAYVWTVLSAQQYVSLTHDVRKKRSDDTNPLIAVVENLSQQVTAMRSQLNALDAKISALQTNVAFHAEFSQDPNSLGPMAPLIMDKAITNIGNGYDAHTGNFHVQVSGTYMIVVSFMAPIEVPLYVSIMVDDTEMDVGLSHGAGNHWDHVTETLVVQLKQGQRVWLRQAENLVRSVRGARWSTFSGFLIGPDP